MKVFTVADWQAKQRPIMGHRRGKERCHNVLRPTWSGDGRRAFYACQVCDYREERECPRGAQLELELAAPARAPLTVDRRRKATRELLKVAAELRRPDER